MSCELVNELRAPCERGIRIGGSEDFSILSLNGDSQDDPLMNRTVQYEHYDG